MQGGLSTAPSFAPRHSWENAVSTADREAPQPFPEGLAVELSSAAGPTPSRSSSDPVSTAARQLLPPYSAHAMLQPDVASNYGHAHDLMDCD